MRHLLIIGTLFNLFTQAAMAADCGPGTPYTCKKETQAWSGDHKFNIQTTCNEICNKRGRPGWSSGSCTTAGSGSCECECTVPNIPDGPYKDTCDVNTIKFEGFILHAKCADDSSYPDEYHLEESIDIRKCQQPIKIKNCFGNLECEENPCDSFQKRAAHR